MKKLFFTVAAIAALAVSSYGATYKSFTLLSSQVDTLIVNGLLGWTNSLYLNGTNVTGCSYTNGGGTLVTTPANAQFNGLGDAPLWKDAFPSGVSLTSDTTNMTLPTLSIEWHSNLNATLRLMLVPVFGDNLTSVAAGGQANGTALVDFWNITLPVITGNTRTYVTNIALPVNVFRHAKAVRLVQVTALTNAALPVANVPRVYSCTLNGWVE